MNSEFDSGAEEVRDHTKWLWVGITVALVAMVGAMAIWGGVEADQSQVVARHILIQCNFNNPAEVAQALQTIEDLREQLVNEEEEFATLARNYSQDPSSSSRGGSLPPAPPGYYDDAFDNYVWGAPEGEISQPIQTSYGYHIIQVLRRDLSKADVYEQEIRERVYEQMREEGQDPDAEAASGNN